VDQHRQAVGEPEALVRDRDLLDQRRDRGRLGGAGDGDGRGFGGAMTATGCGAVAQAASADALASRIVRRRLRCMGLELREKSKIVRTLAEPGASATLLDQRARIFDQRRDPLLLVMGGLGAIPGIPPIPLPHRGNHRPRRASEIR